MRSAALFLPTCRDVAGLLSDYMEGEVPWGQGLGIRLHLSLCPACRRFLASLRSMPGLLRRALEPAGPPVDPAAQAALDAALARIGLPRPRSGDPLVPAPFSETLAPDPADPVLGILAEAQRRLRDSGPAAGPPFLPAEILALLPARQAWRRLHTLGAGETSLLRRDGEVRLLLLGLEAGRRFPEHVHLGRETLLVLQGGLEDGDRHLGPGDWQVHEAGTRHAPSADSQGCWGLVRLEGQVAFTGWRGWLQRLGR